MIRAFQELWKASMTGMQNKGYQGVEGRKEEVEVEA